MSALSDEDYDMPLAQDVDGRDQTTGRPPTQVDDDQDDQNENDFSWVQHDNEPDSAPLGRPPHQIWDEFDAEEQVGRQHKRARCKHCPKVINNAQPSKNLRPHIKRCPGAPPAVKRRVEKMFRDGTPVPVVVAPPSTTIRGGDQARGGATSVSQEEVDSVVAQFFYACAIPFAVADHPAFKAMFELIAPGITPLNRHQLGGQRLEIEYTKSRTNVVERIKEQGTVSIVSDGWTDVNSSSVVNYVVAAPGMPSLFWSSSATGAKQKNAAYMQAEFKRVIKELEQTAEAVVAGTLTDNAQAMINSWEALEAETGVIGGGCAAHVLNLLLNDIFKNVHFARLRDEVLKVVRFVRDHQAVLATFRELQQIVITPPTPRRGLVLPVVTRFYSLHASMRNALTNRPVLEKLFVSGEYEDLLTRNDNAGKRRKRDDVKTLCRNRQFWLELQEAVFLMDPIIEALRELEKDDAPTSRVYERFYWLHTNLRYGLSQPNNQSDLQKLFTDSIKSRWEFLHTNGHGIAFLLDPNTKLNHFIDNDKEATIEEALKVAQKRKIVQTDEESERAFRAQLGQFASDKKDFKKKYHGMDPRHYWRGFGERYRMLQELAQFIFAIPTSSAASERAWSIFDHIHTKKRNKLKPKKVEMLVFIYTNYNTMTKGAFDMARIMSYPDSEDADVMEPNGYARVVV